MDAWSMLEKSIFAYFTSASLTDSLSASSWSMRAVAAVSSEMSAFCAVSCANSAFSAFSLSILADAAVTCSASNCLTKASWASHRSMARVSGPVAAVLVLSSWQA